MAVTPTSGTGIIVDRMRSMIARSATFRAWTGTDSETAALERVYSRRVATFQRPFAMVDLLAGGRFVKRAGGDRDHFQISSVPLMILFEDLTPAIYQGVGLDGDAIVNFENYVSAVMHEAMAYSGTGGNLMIQGWEQATTYMRSLDYDGDEEDYLGVIFDVTVGI